MKFLENQNFTGTEKINFRRYFVVKHVLFTISTEHRAAKWSTIGEIVAQHWDSTIPSTTSYIFQPPAQTFCPLVFFKLSDFLL